MVRCAVYAFLNTPDYARLGPNAPAALREVITACFSGTPRRASGCGRVPTGAEPGAARCRTDAGPGSGSATATSLSRRAGLARVAPRRRWTLGGAAWRWGWAKDPLLIDPKAQQWAWTTASAHSGGRVPAGFAFDRAQAQIDPDHAMSRARLGDAQLELDQDGARSSRFSTRRRSCRTGRAPDDQRLLLEAAMGMARRDNPGALRAYSTLAGRNQKSAPLLVDLGCAHEAMGAYPKRSRVIARPDSSMPRIPRLFCGWGFCMAGREIPLRRKPPSSVPRSSSARGRVEGLRVSP